MTLAEIIIKAWTDFIIMINALTIYYFDFDLLQIPVSYFGITITLYQFIIWTLTWLTFAALALVIILILRWLIRLIKKR